MTPIYQLSAMPLVDRALILQVPDTERRPC